MRHFDLPEWPRVEALGLLFYGFLEALWRPSEAHWKPSGAAGGSLGPSEGPLRPSERL